MSNAAQAPDGALIGSQAALGIGTLTSVRGGRQGEFIVSQLMGPYYQKSYDLNTFIACNTAAVSFATTWASTAPTCVLSNDNNQNPQKNLSILSVATQVTAAPGAASTLGLLFNKSGTNVTHTTAITIQNALLGGAAPSAAKFDAASTVPTAPILLMPLVSILAASAIDEAVSYIELKGALIVPPGGYICISGNAAATGVGSFLFQEELL